MFRLYQSVDQSFFHMFKFGRLLHIDLITYLIIFLELQKAGKTESLETPKG